MKLLLYSHSFSPNIGGIETVVRALAQGLAETRDSQGAREFDVTVVTETPAPSEDTSLNYRIVRHPTVARLRRLIRASDIVHLAGPALLPLWLSRISRKPVVIEHHGYQSICPNGLLLQLPNRQVCPGHFAARNYGACLRCESQELSSLGAIKSVLLTFPRRFLAREADCNIAITNHVSGRLALPCSSVIYHGVEPFLSEAPPDPSHSPSKISFGYLGRFVPEKGIPVLLEATRQLAGKGFSFDVQLIGDGPERSRLQEMINRMGLHELVLIRGFLTGAALADALQQIHVIVMPSIWEETAGLSAMEQMMRGKAVIASDIGGLGEVVADSGLRFSPGQADALAQCMSSVLSNPSLIPELGCRAVQRAHQLFSLRQMVERHAQLYRDLLNQQGDQRGHPRGIDE